jgi:hypothetical protein
MPTVDFPSLFPWSFLNPPDSGSVSLSLCTHHRSLDRSSRHRRRENTLPFQITLLFRVAFPFQVALPTQVGIRISRSSPSHLAGCLSQLPRPTLKVACRRIRTGSYTVPSIPALHVIFTSISCHSCDSLRSCSLVGISPSALSRNCSTTHGRHHEQREDGRWTQGDSLGTAERAAGVQTSRLASSARDWRQQGDAQATRN